MFDIPVAHLFATSQLVDRLKQKGLKNAVIVAPDLGAATLARHLADELALPVAIIDKQRVSGMGEIDRQLG